MKEINCIIEGRVQGVFFRDFTRRKARKLNLFGFVRNTEDGRVKVIAQGGEESLEKLIEYLKEGSVASKVENVVVKWQEPTERYNKFEIK